MTKSRLDALLVDRGICESRSRAAASVIAGNVFIGEERRRANKPGQLVPEDILIDVRQLPQFVSRGGQKLSNALIATGVSVKGRNCLDIGASTGGFTDCLLQAGAAHVVAVDVAYGELHWNIRNDPRVTVIERQNARSLSSDQLPYAAEMTAIDVSFISLAKVLPAVFACCAQIFDCLALVKPQFEVGREKVGKGGVVRDIEDRVQALVNVASMAQSIGAAVLGFASSELPGPKGNRETFIWLAEKGRSGELPPAQLENAARKASP